MGLWLCSRGERESIALMQEFPEWIASMLRIPVLDGSDSGNRSYPFPELQEMVLIIVGIRGNEYRGGNRFPNV